MDFSKFLDLKYFFATEPAPLHPLQNGIVLVLLIVVSLGMVVSWLVRHFRRGDIVSVKLWGKLFNFCLVFTLSGWFFYFCREQGVYFLSRRFWFAVWFIGALVWIVFTLRYIFVRVPKERQTLQRKEEFEKYLPKSRG